VFITEDIDKTTILEIQNWGNKKRDNVNIFWFVTGMELSQFLCHRANDDEHLFRENQVLD